MTRSPMQARVPMQLAIFAAAAAQALLGAAHQLRVVPRGGPAAAGVGPGCRPCLAAAGGVFRRRRSGGPDSNYTSDDAPSAPCDPDCVPMNGSVVHEENAAMDDWLRETDGAGARQYRSAGEGISQNDFNYTHNGTNVGNTPCGSQCRAGAGADAPQPTPVGGQQGGFELVGINKQCLHNQRGHAFRGINETTCQLRCNVTSTCSHMVWYVDGRTTACELVLGCTCKLAAGDEKNRIWHRLKPAACG